MIPANFPQRHEKRAKEATERQEAFGKLSPQQRLHLLDARLGAGVGAVKQRAKLAKLISAPVEPKSRKSK